MIGRRDFVGLGAALVVASGSHGAKACTITAERKATKMKRQARRMVAAKGFIKQISGKNWDGLAALIGDERWRLNERWIEPLNIVDLKSAVTSVFPDFVSLEIQDAAIIAERVFAGATLWFDDPESDCGAGPFGRQQYLTFEFRVDRISGVEIVNG